MARPTNAELSAKMAEMAALIASMSERTRTSHPKLGQKIGAMTRELESLKAEVNRLNSSADSSPILRGRMLSLENHVNEQLSALTQGQTDLSARVATTARTLEEHGHTLDAHSGRLNALEAGAGSISVAVARAQAQIDALRRGPAFNWMAAIITAAIGLAVYFFWFVSHDFSGAVLNSQHQATGMITRSLLNTGWGDAIALIVILLLSYGIGSLFARKADSGERLVASATATASTTTAPAARPTLIGSSRPSGAASSSAR
jgi:hypothetical protein